MFGQVIIFEKQMSSFEFYIIFHYHISEESNNKYKRVVKSLAIIFFCNVKPNSTAPNTFVEVFVGCREFNVRFNRSQ